MLITTTPVTDEADAGCEAAFTALDFYRRHGAGLCDLLGLLADEIAFDSLCDLHGQFDSALPNVSLVLGAFQTIHAALAARTTLDFQDLSIRKGYCVDAAVRWYSARISELLAAFR